MSSILRCTFVPATLLFILSGQAPAVVTIDFDDLAVGTIVSNQYDGVTFSAQPGSCGGGNPKTLIVDPTGTTSSGTHALSLQTGCPDFSADFIRIVFESNQSEVTFILGGETPPGTYEIRGYSTPSGAAGEFGVPDVVIPAGASGVNRFVRVTHLGMSDIRRIEIEDSIGEFEVIDDLTFESDVTPPTADITLPLYQACACGIVNVRGVACDSDGDYGFDKLQYRVVDAEPADPWVQVGTFTSPVCVENTLYNWNTAAVAEGWYTLLLTVQNANGLQSQDSVVVLVDKHFETVNIRSPAANAIVGGVVCIDGTVSDHCFDHYFVEFRVVGGGAFTAVDALNPQYNSAVVTDGLATWNTTALADGNYELRVRDVDTCGNTAEVVRVVTIDNTAPNAAITSPLACGRINGIVAINGTASDTHFDRYQLQYVGGSATDWTDIVPSNSTPVVGGLLGNWNTAGLTRCAYVIRLVVHEDTITDCCGGQRSRTSYISVDLGLCCDLNGDGVGDGLDVQPFTDCILGAVCP